MYTIMGGTYFNSHQCMKVTLQKKKVLSLSKLLQASDYLSKIGICSDRWKPRKPVMIVGLRDSNTGLFEYQAEDLSTKPKRSAVNSF
jgi:hypothetical protein